MQSLGVDTETLKKQGRDFVASKYVRMTESKRVAMLVVRIKELLVEYDEDLTRYFDKNSHWILAVTGCIITSFLVVVISNYLTARQGRYAKKELNDQLSNALEDVRKLQEKLKVIDTTELAERLKDAKEKGKEIRIWMDGAFDMMHYGHMNAFRQGKALGTYLIVGVNSDASITVNKGQPVCNDEERIETVKGCKFVDEVVTDVPYVMNPEYVMHIIEKYDLDFIVHGDDPCLTPDGKDVYAAAKDMDKYRSIPRTEGVSTTDIVGRMLLNTREHHNKDDDDAGENKMTGLGRVRAASFNPEMDGADGGYGTDDNSVMSVAEAMGGNSLHEILTHRRSNFLTTSHILRLFSMGVHPPAKTDRVVYIAGDWDMFHAGHIVALQQARAMGDYLIVGVHADSIVNARFGYNLPIMNLQERVLSVLGCKGVDDVLIDAPYQITSDMVSSLNISTVVQSDVDDIDHSGSALNLTALHDPSEDPYLYVRRAGILKKISNGKKFRKLTVLDIVDRIKDQRVRFEKKFAKKKAAEDEYYKNRYASSNNQEE